MQASRKIPVTNGVSQKLYLEWKIQLSLKIPAVIINKTTYKLMASPLFQIVVPGRARQSRLRFPAL
jgi:hypothetical protein